MRKVTCEAEWKEFDRGKSAYKVEERIEKERIKLSWLCLVLPPVQMERIGSSSFFCRNPLTSTNANGRRAKARLSRASRYSNLKRKSTRVSPFSRHLLFRFPRFLELFFIFVFLCFVLCPGLISTRILSVVRVLQNTG